MTKKVRIPNQGRKQKKVKDGKPQLAKARCPVCDVWATHFINGLMLTVSASDPKNVQPVAFCICMKCGGNFTPMHEVNRILGNLGPAPEKPSEKRRILTPAEAGNITHLRPPK
jgi:hypothetical protein